MSFRVEPLGDHDLARFQSGSAELDHWLIRHARAATGQGTRTYVLLDSDAVVVGYFAIAPHYLNREDASRKVARGAPRQIPALLLAKLALDESLHGEGLGAELLVTALATMVEAARKAGGRLVVVDAIDESAVRFYERHDFHRLPDDDRRLVMKMSTAAKALGVAWP